MAWAIRGAGGTEFLSFATVNRSDASWRIEFRVLNPETSSNVTKRLLGQTSNFNDYIGVMWNAVQDAVIYRVDGSNASLNSLPPVTNDQDFHDYVIIDDGTDITLQIDSETIVTSLGSGGTDFKDFNSFFRANNAFYAYDLEYFRYFDADVAGTLIHDWDATNSSHSAGVPVLTDFGTAGNDATGVNMPTDGSAWINLGGGGISIPVIMNQLRNQGIN